MRFNWCQYSLEPSSEKWLGLASIRDGRVFSRAPLTFAVCRWKFSASVVGKPCRGSVGRQIKHSWEWSRSSSLTDARRPLLIFLFVFLGANSWASMFPFFKMWLSKEANWAFRLRKTFCFLLTFSVEMLICYWSTCHCIKVLLGGCPPSSPSYASRVRFCFLHPTAALIWLCMPGVITVPTSA